MGKSNLQKRDQLMFGVIAIVVVIAIIVIVVMVNKNKGTVESNVPATTDQTAATTSENVKVSENGSKENVSTKLKEEKKYEGMSIKDIKLIANANVTEFVATVENTTGTDFTGAPVTIVFTNKTGEEVSRLEAYIGDTKAGQLSYINASATTDLTDAYDFSIVKK